ncbi:MAG: hypothetical protein U0787_24080 [Polyangia bacterium]
MTRKTQGLIRSVGTLLFVGTLGCSQIVTVEVKPSDCINPSSGNCTGGFGDSRILDVRLYQLKDAVDRCKLDVDLLAQGKEQEVLKGVLVEQASKQSTSLSFKVTANEPRSLGSWEIAAETKYVLAVAFGRSAGPGTVRLIPRQDIRMFFPTLYFRGYDICVGTPCGQATATEQQECGK